MNQFDQKPDPFEAFGPKPTPPPFSTPFPTTPATQVVNSPTPPEGGVQREQFLRDELQKHEKYRAELRALNAQVPDPDPRPLLVVGMAHGDVVRDGRRYKQGEPFQIANRSKYMTWMKVRGRVNPDGSLDASPEAIASV